MKIRGLGFLLLVLVFLPSCIPFGSDEKKDAEKPAPVKTGAKIPGSKTVALIDGEPVVSIEEFESAFSALKQAQPMMDQMISMLPENQQRDIFSQLVNNVVATVVVEDHVHAKGWSKQADYVRESEKFHRDLDRELANRELQKRILEGLSVSRREAEKFYNKNRETNMYFKRPPFLISPEGIKARAMVFDSESAASAAYAQLEKGGAFKKVADEHKTCIRDLGVVSVQTSDLDRMVLVKIIQMKDVPAFDMVQGGDGKHWVIEGIKKREAQYAAFGDVEKHVIDFVKNDKFMKKYNAEVKKLVQKREVTVNKDIIESYVVKRPKPEGEAAPLAEDEK